MRLITCDNKGELGQRAAEHGSNVIRDAIALRGRASIIVATGVSQFEMLSALVHLPGDVAFVGIGENGHLAFNDPPADFDTQSPYIIVSLDEACKQQQWSEGWFASINDVPAQAISMSIQHILKSRAIIACVPDQRKAIAVKACAQGSVSPRAPASMLHANGRLSQYDTPYLAGSASSLKDGVENVVSTSSPRSSKAE